VICREGNKVHDHVERPATERGTHRRRIPYVGPEHLRVFRGGAHGCAAAVQHGQSVPDGDRPFGSSGADNPGSADEQDPQGGVAGESGGEGVHAFYHV